MANFDEFLNLIAIMDVEEAEVLADQPRRIFHVRDDPFETLSDINFTREYRLTKNMVEELINILEPIMVAGTRTSALGVKEKVEYIVLVVFKKHDFIIF